MVGTLDFGVLFKLSVNDNLKGFFVKGCPSDKQQGGGGSREGPEGSRHRWQRPGKQLTDEHLSKGTVEGTASAASADGKGIGFRLVVVNILKISFIGVRKNEYRNFIRLL